MSEDQKYYSQCTIKVQGAYLPPEQQAKVVNIVVEQNLYLPAALTVTLHDAGSGESAQDPLHFGLADNTGFIPIGAEIEVAVGRNEQPVVVFQGEVTMQDLDISRNEAPVLAVRAYDRGHRLQRERKARTFKNVTDSDIASTLAGEAGLSAQTDATSVVYDLVRQNNQTNWEFLQQRAQRIGYEVFVENRTLHFRKPQTGTGAAGTQKMWESMLHLRIHQTSVAQVQQVTVRGWDAIGKKSLVGQASSASAAMATGGGHKTSAQLAQLFDSPAATLASLTTVSQAEATTIAQAALDDITGASVHVEGEIMGDPALKPGIPINLENLGQRFTAKYYITSATHRFGSAGGYTTLFTVGGRRSDTLLDLVAGTNGANGNGHSVGHGLGDGVAIGVVTNNKDDKDLGRVKVSFPWLADQDESDWARIVTPSGGSSRGIYWLPEVNDEVVVGFEQGDVHRPFVIGALWNSSDAPPKKNSEVVGGDGKVNQRIMKSRSGHTITLDDTDGSENITIVDKSGNHTITVDTKNNKITMVTQGDLEMTATGDIKMTGKNVKVTANQDCTIDATANYKVTANQNCELTSSGGDAKLSGLNTTIQGQMAAKLTGAQASVEGQAQTAIKGAIVNIN